VQQPLGRLRECGADAMIQSRQSVGVDRDCRLREREDFLADAGVPGKVRAARRAGDAASSKRTSAASMPSTLVPDIRPR